LDLYLGISFFLFQEGLQTVDWAYTHPPILFLALEIFLPKQKEILFLVNFARQAKYKSSTQKEEYAITRSHMCSLCLSCWRGFDPSPFPVPFRSSLLGCSSFGSAQHLWCRYYHRKFQRSTTASFLHGDCHNNVLVNLDNEKWCHLQKCSPFFTSMQAGVSQRICSSYTTSKINLSSSYRFMARSFSVIFLIFFLTFFVSWDLLYFLLDL
jgi:sarcosine oxidase delta subunit